MYAVSELIRKVKNIVRVAKIISTKSDDSRALATLKISATEESQLSPVLNFSNSFKKHWIPSRKGEQTLLFYPFGNANRGFIFRSFFHKKIKEPKKFNATTEVMEFEDKSSIIYDSDSSIFQIDIHGDITISSKKDIELNASKTIISSKNFTVDGGGNLTISGMATDGKGCNLNVHGHKILQCKKLCKTPGEAINLMCSGSGGSIEDVAHADKREESIGSQGADVAQNRGESAICLVCESH